MAPQPPLFCPFCRECFEGEAVCPDHELTLVSFEKLPRRGRSTVGLDERVQVYDVRYGRGFLWGAALLLLFGLALPLVTATLADTTSFSGFEVASRVAPSLWAVPCVSAALVSVLVRRRTLRQMLAARVAVPMLALLGATALGYTFWRIDRGAVQMSERMGEEVAVGLGPGVWVLGAGLLLALVGGLRLGSTPRGKAPPRGGEPGEPADPIVVDDDDRH